jgi:hypothetical protein
VLRQAYLTLTSTRIANLSALFIAGFGPIDHFIAQSRALCRKRLGITLKEDADGYLYTGASAKRKAFCCLASLPVFWAAHNILFAFW